MAKARVTTSSWRRESVEECANRLSISRAGAEAYAQLDVVDLHLDTFIWQRLLGYDVGKRHSLGVFRGSFLGQVDLPRLRTVDLASATWVITTNPLRGARGRRRAFERNLASIKRTLANYPEDVQLVKTLTDFRQARTTGRHAAFIGIQGGNALDYDLDCLDLLDQGDVLRVTLVHMSTSRLGGTSAPSFRGGDGLSAFGAEFVQLLNNKRVFVDLAHASKRLFFDALEHHDPSIPPIVTHTGVASVRNHWRNLDDNQLRAIADRGGIVGVMYHSWYLTPFGATCTHQDVVRHVLHIMRVVGEDHVALGSDWDGAIVPPGDLRSVDMLPRLIDGLLRAGLTETQLEKICAQNFLRVLRDLRG